MGRLLDEKKEADISVLLPFLGKVIRFDNKPYKIKSLKAVVGGVKVTLSNDIGELIVNNGYRSEVIDVNKCREWFKLSVGERL